MHTFINFATEYYYIWIIGAIVCLIMMITTGILWENSGRSDVERSAAMLVAMKFFAIMLTPFCVMTAITIITVFLRAIVGK